MALAVVFAVLLTSAYMVYQCFNVAAQGVRDREVLSGIRLTGVRFVNTSQALLEQGFFTASATLDNPNNATVEVTKLGVTLRQMEDFGFADVASGSPDLPATLESGEREFLIEVHFRWNTTLKTPNYFTANYRVECGLASMDFTCAAEDSAVTTEGPFSADDDPAFSLVWTYLIGLCASWVIGFDVFAVAFLYLKRRSHGSSGASVKTAVQGEKAMLAAFFALEGSSLILLWFSYRIVSLLIAPLPSQYLHASGAGAIAADMMLGMLALGALGCFAAAAMVFIKGGGSLLGLVVCVLGITAWGGLGLLGFVSTLVVRIMNGDIETLGTLPNLQTVAWAMLFMAFAVGNLIVLIRLRKDRFTAPLPAQVRKPPVS